jgi:p-aminobenzoyl-glutamate transporter AbgT
MKTTKRKILTAVLFLLWLLPGISSAAISLNLDYPKIADFDLNSQQDLNQVVAWFYYSAFLGLLLILASYLIIQVINPELLALNLPEMP